MYRNRSSLRKCAEPGLAAALCHKAAVSSSV